MKELLFGTAYYDEYMPYDRLEQDVAMMKKAGINVVRIAESTWSTCEPQEGVFDFSHVERVMAAMEEAGINVIIGTPTYAVPTWMVQSHPDVLVTTVNGRALYGSRQIMDISHPVYRFYSERVIRKLMECTAHRKCVIGFQIDNETKNYGTAGKNVQEKFIKYLRKKFNNDLDALNDAFGLDYWSNRINTWEDFPDIRGTINGSLGAEFEKFQRMLVDDFLQWQADIVKQYKRKDQFITHNFDFEWRGHSFGVQPEVNHYHAAKALTIAGVDVYHPSQDALTGTEIAFGGDMTRSLKQNNYLLIETQAQGWPDWTPYKGQLRLQAYSHLASGANSVMYWHWHSIHNSMETYWKGLLSHDFEENATYQEACIIGNEWKVIGSHLVNLKKKNDVAILVSNEALTGLNWFGIEASASGNHGIRYNDVVRWMYDVLYRMNIECDILWPESENLEQYKVILVPALYAAPESLLHRLNRYVEEGGTLLATFKTGFTNENLRVSHEVQPHILHKCLGVTYHQFAFPNQVGLLGDWKPQNGIDCKAKVFMELLIPDSAKTLLSYDHYNWKEYAAFTCNQYGSGNAFYLGCMTGEKLLEEILKKVLQTASVELPSENYPVIIKKGTNDYGKMVRYYLNYSPEVQKLSYCFADGKDLFTGQAIANGDELEIEPWNLKIIEEDAER